MRDNVVKTRSVTIDVVEEINMNGTTGGKIHTGTDIILPKSAVDEGKLNKIARGIIELHEQNEKETSIVNDIDGLYWDGAFALYQAMYDMFGTVIGQDIYTFFGKQLPEIKNVEIGYRKTTQIPMGRFGIPGLDDGFIQTGHTRKAGRIIFQFTATVKGRHKGKIEALAKLARQYARDKSIYRGQAFRLSFFDSDGEQVQFPEPEFLNLERGEPFVTFDKKTMLLIESNVWTPIMKTKQCRDEKVPLKRGILLAGPYGTGKTLIAFKTAYLAHQFGWTFIYCKANELPEAIRFAQLYQPCAAFAEDIERATAGQERTKEIDEVLNALDGVDTKESEIITVMTSNHLELINRAMIRPGRIDTVARILFPQEPETVSNLIRHYGGVSINPKMDLTTVGTILVNQSPANISEVVQRAKLYQINFGSSSAKFLELSALEAAAREITEQVKTTSTDPAAEEEGVKMFRIFGEKLGQEIGQSVRQGMKAMASR